MQHIQCEKVFSRSAETVLCCISCDNEFSTDIERYKCTCGSLLELRHPVFEKDMPQRFEKRRIGTGVGAQSGVWRFGDCVLPVAEKNIVSHPEGNTRLYQRESLGRYAGVSDLFFKHEGENPTGSFKDRGMTVAVTQARVLGRTLLGCASTGNTSASLASYAAQAENMQALVFLPAGKVSSGKLAQASAYGSVCVEVSGDFDAAMNLIERASGELGLYLVNSVNPFRLEGQKTIIWEILQEFAWESPDWIVVPGGNLGNTSAFGKAIREAYCAGWISKLPRLAVIQAEGASPFFRSFETNFSSFAPMQAETIASAIRIGNPVNYTKALQVIKDLDGVVVSVSDSEIKAAKAEIDCSGVGCEPASACSLAGIKKLVNSGAMNSSQRVVGILTGHLLKDSEVSIEIAHSAFGKARTVQVGTDLGPLKDYLKRMI